MPRGNVWQRARPMPRLLTFSQHGCRVLYNNTIACCGDVQNSTFAINRDRQGTDGVQVYPGIIVYRSKKRRAGLAKTPTIPNHADPKTKERHDDFRYFTLLRCECVNNFQIRSCRRSTAPVVSFRSVRHLKVGLSFMFAHEDGLMGVRGQMR